MRLVYDLKRLGPQDYDRALERILGDLRRIRAVRAVYQFGEVSHPGISDLDLLIVVDDNIRRRALHAVLKAARRDELTRYVCSHPPIVAPVSSLPHAARVHSLRNLRHVWGRHDEIPTPGAEEQVRLALAEYIDFTFAVRTVLRSLGRDAAGLRSVLLLLKSCMHSLAFASVITGEPVHPTLSVRLEQLRRDSFAERSRVRDEIPAVVGDTIAALQDADRLVEARLHVTHMLNGERIAHTITHPDGHFYFFRSPFGETAPDGRQSLAASRWLRYLSVDSSVEVFPGFYLAQFAAYAGGRGRYGAIHRAVFGMQPAELILDDLYRKLLTLRVETAERVHRVVRRGGHIPMVPLGIGFRNPERIQLSLRRRFLKGYLTRQLTQGRS